MNCSACDDFCLHNGSPAAGRECRWTGCQVIAERETAKWPCPLVLDLTSSDGRDSAFAVEFLAWKRGLLDELLGRYAAEAAGLLRLHFELEMVRIHGMRVTDGREEGAGCRG